MLISRQNADDDRIETLEAMIKEANEAAREAENKLDEVSARAQFRQIQLWLIFLSSGFRLWRCACDSVLCEA